MRALIIGGAGFVGGYLIDELLASGYKVHATCLDHENIRKPCTVHKLDILDAERTAELISEVEPDVIYHLAAQSSVALSWKKPQLTAEINVVGAINVLEGARSAENPMRIILIGSGEEYGYIRENACPLTESEPLNPGNIYAATKVCQEMIGKIYAKAYKMNIVMVRAFNHSGPEQSPIFVISDFCRQIAEIELGMREPKMQVGNLEAMRDFTDVRDIVRAYRLLAEKGIAGRVYNVGRGNAVPIRHILDTALSLTTAKITIERDPSRFRTAEIPIIEPDISLITADTGWRPEIPLGKTVADTLGFHRKELGKHI